MTSEGSRRDPLPRPSLWDDLRTLGRGAEARRLRELLDLESRSVLLDVGGGSGAFTARFAAGAARIVVLDPGVGPSAPTPRVRPGIEYRSGGGESIPLADGSVDRVTAIRSTHHMESPEQFVREAYRVLRPAGRLVIEELQPGSGFARVFARTAHRHHGAPLDLRGPSDWSQIVRVAGFEKLRAIDGARWFFVLGIRAA
ncbi:MAG: class I SAM-dependent methyltransferase [Thermoplasmata archaeon]|nr:class I SAM-dependent methyltransferase [Thermoplasmata archaeon]